MLKKIPKFTTVKEEYPDENERYLMVYADGVKIGEVFEDSSLGFYIAQYSYRRKTKGAMERQAIAKFPLRAGFAWLKEMYRRNN